MRTISTTLGFDAGVYHPTRPDARFPNASKPGGTRSRGRILRIAKSDTVSIRVSNGQVKRLRYLADAEGVSLYTQDVKNIWDSDFLTLKQRVGGSSPPRLTTFLRSD
jgi:hypothetical protein